MAALSSLESRENGGLMSASEIVRAYEAGLITEREAAEQGMVERLSDLYADLSPYARQHASSPQRLSARTPR